MRFTRTRTHLSDGCTALARGFLWLALRCRGLREGAIAVPTTSLAEFFTRK